MPARVFVAIDVGDAVRAEAARVIQVITHKTDAVRTPRKITWVKPTALHVTLRFIGEVDEAAPPALCQQLAPPFDMTPFEVEWCGIGAFPSPRHPRVLWLGVVAGGSALGARSMVDRVTLYRSHLTHRGPHYTGLVSTPLVWTSFPPS